MNDEEILDSPHILDRSVKALFRECPDAILRLAGMTVKMDAIRVEDPNLNLPELRADHVFILPEGAVYLEYQIKPDTSLLPSWCAKWGGLLRQLGMNVTLLVLYLQKGDYATFHDNFSAKVGRLETKLQFNTIRLWEHTEQIKSGKIPELAPLLLLCEKNPTEQTLREEVKLIRESKLPVDVQTELLGIALLVATRQFARDILESIFREDLSEMEGISIVQDWIKKGYAKGEAEGRAAGEAEGRVKGEAEGRAVGETQGIRKTTLRVLSRRFGNLPETLQKQIEEADAEWCQNLLDRSLAVENLAELNLDAPE